MSLLRKFATALDSAVLKILGPMMAAEDIAKIIGFIENAGTPNSSVTPLFKGQVCLDTTNNAWYRAKGTANTDWVLQGNSGNLTDQSGNATNVGAINAATGLSVSITRMGSFFKLDFTLTAVSLTVTDAAGSGSSASLKLFDFVQGAMTVLGCRQDYTAFAEGAALTGGAGDAAFVMGLGSVAADAGDGALTGTEVDIGSVTSTITLSGGTGTGTKTSGSLGAIDGTGTAVDLYLNWSGTAATIDANSTISVTGTISVVGVLLGDD